MPCYYNFSVRKVCHNVFFSHTRNLSNSNWKLEVREDILTRSLFHCVILLVLNEKWFGGAECLVHDKLGIAHANTLKKLKWHHQRNKNKCCKVRKPAQTQKYRIKNVTQQTQSGKKKQPKTENTNPET